MSISERGPSRSVEAPTRPCLSVTNGPGNLVESTYVASIPQHVNQLCALPMATLPDYAHNESYAYYSLSGSTAPVGGSHTLDCLSTDVGIQQKNLTVVGRSSSDKEPSCPNICPEFESYADTSPASRI